MRSVFLSAFFVACSPADQTDLPDTHSSDTGDTGTLPDSGLTEDTAAADTPTDCFGLEGYRGYRSLLQTPNSETLLADFPISVPNLIRLGNTDWLSAQIFQDFSAHCDVIAFAPLDELPSDKTHPMSPVAIENLPALGEINGRANMIFPPADPTLVHLGDHEETLLITTLRLADKPDDPCIGMALAFDPWDPTEGFRFLEQTLWCKPGIALMDAAAYYDENKSVIHLVAADFAKPGVSNYHAKVTASGRLEDWAVMDEGQLPFQDFHLLGNFSEGDGLCAGPTFFGTQNKDGERNAAAACFDPAFADFQVVDGFEIPNIGDPAVLPSSVNANSILVYSAQK
jgi:hypothetical protein